MPLNPNGTWYQQFMPNINNMPISDIIFVDSLNGYAITGDQTPNDTNYILKTTSGGDSWNIVYRAYRNHLRIKFLNLNTGFVCGGFNTSSGELIKTTNAGINWQPLNTPGSIWYDDMSLFGEDTMWLVQRSSLDGGVFFTSNGGANWQNQFSSGNQNPNKIYMYNARIGFMSNSSALPNIYKTTNGGVNWILNVSGQNIRDMTFTDSLTGWYSHGTGVYKTTNCGNNWITQILPTGGNIFVTGVNKFSALNQDTLWAVGGVMAVGSGSRGILYRTIDGGNNWLFNLPDTSINNFMYYHLQFINRRIGWAYSTIRGIHTTNGGDPIWFTGIEQISSEVPKEYRLYQNYPNPFNPVTNIKYAVKRETSNVKLVIFDINGKEIFKLVDKEQSAGTYKVDWNAAGYSTGVYFYSLFVNEIMTDTKKMILVK